MIKGVNRLLPEGAFLVCALAGAAGSLALMLYAGRRQQSPILILLFAIWVLSPFIAAVVANSVLRRWAVITRAALDVAMVVLTLGSLTVYGSVAFGYLNAKIGFVFLVVPFASWLLVALAVATAVLIHGRHSRT